MKLSDIKNGNLSAEWAEKGYELPKFDVEAVKAKTHAEPTWVHFGAGNIFRAFPAAILNEALNQARVEETGLRIPKLLEVRKVNGKWAIVTEFVEGETLQSLMEQNPDQLESYMEQFVLLQKEIQSKRSPLLTKLKDKMNRKISQSGLDATTRYDLHTRLNAMHDHIKVCHGDFNPSNVIVDKDGRLYVIDWSHATQGNGSADAARTYLLFKLDCPSDE